MAGGAGLLPTGQVPVAGRHVHRRPAFQADNLRSSRSTVRGSRCWDY